MSGSGATWRRYALASAIGAVAGGIVVSLATKAIPKMMSLTMHSMMVQMREAGCDPTEM